MLLIHLSKPIPCRVLSTLSLAPLFLALAACMSTGGIAPQQQVISATQLQSDVAIQSAARDARWPTQAWWQAYGDPQLDRWIEDATANSPTLEEAGARVRLALSMAGVAESAESPQVGASASIQRKRWPGDYFYGPGELGQTETWDKNAGLNLSYSLDLWGKDRDNSAQYLNIAYMTAAQARMAELDLQGTIVRTYIHLSLAYAEHDIAQATLDQQQRILDLAQRRRAGGLGTDFEISQAQVPIPEARRRLEALDEDIALSRNQLAALAGKGPGAGASLQRPRLNLTATPGLPSQVPMELLGHRPDVVAGRWKVAAQAKGVDVARAEFYPDINLAANLGFSAVGGGMLEFLKDQKLGWGIGPTLSLPIFDGGRLRSELGEASAGYDAAVAQYNGTLVNALKSISDQLIRLRSLHQQQIYAQQGETSAQHTYDLAMTAFKGGLTDYLSVLNAQTRLFDEQSVVQQIDADLLTANANLIIALGGAEVDAKQSPTAGQMLPQRVSIKPARGGSHA